MIASAVRSSDRFLLLWAGLIMTVVVVIFPAGYFGISYRYDVGRLESEVEDASDVLSRIIGANPEMWQFETVRIEEHLARHRGTDRQVLRRIKNMDGEVVAAVGDVPREPVLIRSASLHDAGQVVGSVEVSTSLAPTLTDAALLALFLSPLGVSALLVLGLMPARAIRREVAAALQRERDTGQRYLDIAGVMLVALDRQGRVTLMNRRACEVTGYTEEEVLHRNWFEFVPEPNRAQTWELLSALPPTPGELTLSEFPILTKEGKERIVAWHHSVLIDASGARVGTLSSGEDITERKELENQLRHAQKMDALGQLATGVAHDFNNILTVIAGYCSLIRSRAGKDEQLGLIDQLTAAAERASQLTRSLLSFSRKQPSLQRPYALNEILRQFQVFLDRIIGEDIEVRLVYSPEQLVIRAERGQIEQVLINLATNARDAMPHGGVLTIETSLQRAPACDGNCKGETCALITVSDTGCGMDEATRRRIFEPFFTTKEAGKGTGLGLAIVYGIVRQHNGSMEVASEIGSGTSVTIRIPCLHEAAVEPRPEPRRHPGRGSETILVAEDDPNVSRMVVSVLSDLGYKVLLAEDGEQAVELFRENPGRVDLCVLDVVMSKKSGKEAYRDISGLQPGAKVLFTSGYPVHAMGERWEVGEDANLLMKPFKPLDLAARVREMLDLPQGGSSAPVKVAQGC